MCLTNKLAVSRKGEKLICNFAEIAHNVRGQKANGLKPTQPFLGETCISIGIFFVFCFNLFLHPTSSICRDSLPSLFLSPHLPGAFVERVRGGCGGKLRMSPGALKGIPIVCFSPQAERELLLYTFVLQQRNNTGRWPRRKTHPCGRAPGH